MLAMPAESDLAVEQAQCGRADEYRRRKDTALLAIAFADIADSTALLETLGENRYDELRGAHNELVREIVEQDDAGSVVQFYGDGALAVFSEPSTAVERCLRLVRETQSRSPFRLRVGIDVGQVARKSREGTVLEVFGRHVNRAARIESLAEAGHVLASYSVYDFAVGWLRVLGVEWKALGVVTPKGFSDPVSIHEPFLPAGPGPQEPFPRATTMMYLVQETGGAEARHEVVPEGTMTRIASGPETVMATGITRVGPLPGTDFADLPPSRVGIGEDPLAHYLRLLGSKVARVRRSPLRWVRAFLGKCMAVPTLLWVDDYPANNSSLQELIEGCGCRVQNALDTDEAMERILAGPIDLIITDMGRGENPTAGLELLARVRGAGLRHPMAVFSSPRAVAEYGEEAQSLGAMVCTSGTVQLFDFLTQHIH